MATTHSPLPPFRPGDTAISWLTRMRDRYPKESHERIELEYGIRLLSQPPASPTIVDLQQDVAELRALGLPYRQIATEMGLRLSDLLFAVTGFAVVWRNPSPPRPRA